MQHSIDASCQLFESVGRMCRMIKSITCYKNTMLRLKGYLWAIALLHTAPEAPHTPNAFPTQSKVWLHIRYNDNRLCTVRVISNTEGWMQSVRFLDPRQHCMYTTVWWLHKSTGMLGWHDLRGPINATNDFWRFNFKNGWKADTFQWLHEIIMKMQLYV